MHDARPARPARPLGPWAPGTLGWETWIEFTIYPWDSMGNPGKWLNLGSPQPSSALSQQLGHFFWDHGRGVATKSRDVAVLFARTVGFFFGKASLLLFQFFGNFNVLAWQTDQFCLPYTL